MAGDDVGIAATTFQPVLDINTPNLNSLEVDTGASLAVGTHTLNVTGGGVNAITLFGTGSITVAGGTISSTGGVSLDTGTVISGFGTLTGTCSGTGTLTASGGSLNLTSDVAASSGLTFNVVDSAASILRFDGIVGATNTVSFLGTHGAIELNDVSIATNGLLFAGTVSGLTTATSATLDLSGTNYINVQATITSVVFTDSTHIELFNGTTDLGAITLGSAVNLSTTHVDWVADSTLAGHTIGTGTDIFLSSVVCFAAGTHVLTATGERMVQNLRQGDVVLTLAGDQLSAKPVKWIGRRRIDLTAHPRPEMVAPILIQRGAFADNVPHNDLLLSPDHAIFADGKLICARQLINGTTIRQEMGWTSVEYFHVELDSHAILLTEGLPTESYLSTGNRQFFANSHEPLLLHPDLMDETEYPTREAASCAPFVWDEANVRPVWQRLSERAAMLGQPTPRQETTTDPELRVVVRGRTLQPLSAANGLYLFALPTGATEAHLVSRSGSPTDVRPWLEDRRHLGVYVERIVARGPNETQEIPVDHPGLSQGWRDTERNGTALRRWTNGDAVLPLPMLDGPVMLEIRASSGGMCYIADLEPERRIA